MSGPGDGMDGAAHRAGHPGPPEGPVLRLVRGEATDEELAAVIAVLSARNGPAVGERAPGSRPGTPDAGRSTWSSPALRTSPGDALPLTGEGRPDWRTSLRPR